MWRLVDLIITEVSEKHITIFRVEKIREFSLLILSTLKMEVISPSVKVVLKRPTCATPPDVIFFLLISWTNQIMTCYSPIEYLDCAIYSKVRDSNILHFCIHSYNTFLIATITVFEGSF
jgi:hypothetical protein